MIDLAQEKERIINSMLQIDAQLASLSRRSPERPELIRQKAILAFEHKKIKKKMLAEWDEGKNSFDKECPITDHALVRWLERKHGIDTRRLRAAMLSEQLRTALRSDQKYWSDGDIVFVIDRGAVQTVIPVNDLDEAAA